MNQLLNQLKDNDASCCHELAPESDEFTILNTREFITLKPTVRLIIEEAVALTLLRQQQ